MCENVQMHDYMKILSINGIVFERECENTQVCEWDTVCASVRMLGVSECELQEHWERTHFPKSRVLRDTSTPGPSPVPSATPSSPPPGQVCARDKPVG